MLSIGINEGINGSVVVARDGEILFALQEERLNRSKESAGFPAQALVRALKSLDLAPDQVDEVLLCGTRPPRPFVLRDFDRAADIPAPWLYGFLTGLKPVPPDTHRKNLADAGLARAAVHRLEHHACLADAAYFGRRADPDKPHLVLTADHGGDGLCAAVHLAENGKLKRLAVTPAGHSPSDLYSSVTHFMGLRPLEHEYKLMGLAAYADTAHSQPLADLFHSLLGLDPANPLRFRRTTPEPTALLGRRLQRSLRRPRFDALAGGLQSFTETLMLDWVRAAVRATGVQRAVAAGSLFMNVKANKRIAEEGGLDFFDVFPSCGPESLPFGAVWRRHADVSADHGRILALRQFCLGPDAACDLEEARHEFAGQVIWRTLADPDRAAAELLAQGHVVARCSGRMEFGARALGNRSILADPGHYPVVPLINKMIKQRDFWMPFAPAMLAEDAADYIRIPTCLPADVSPFMMHSFETTERRTDFAAGVHAYDNSARAQIVNADNQPGLHRVLEHFRRLTDKGVLLNTSFNLHGLPLVRGARDAVWVLLNSGLTHLIVDDQLVTKA
ncbi:MAG TPA: carbamoyltransferase C-terminal domain-containing protein [Candidatus Sulfotelmatobacter sp.]|jgi:carbamoyltransferase|nr:carbamoyltransferase C-terminal domain-containing protein [Candidatus Sulfotelmatobacter sp.]